MTNILRLINQKRIVTFLIFSLSFIFVLLFSYSTSILYPCYAYISGDPSQFLTIGKAWYTGLIPYRDMFDHKGPFIYFVNLLGFMITQGKSHIGMFVVQVPFMFFTLQAVYKISQLVSTQVKYGLLSVALTLIFLRNNYQEGNFVEEYCLPFIGFSAYYMLKFLYQKEKQHAIKYGFLYGITLGISFLTRITNFMPVSGLLLMVVCELVIKKQYKNFFQDVIAFLFGLVISIAPFVLYFEAKNCLSDMLFATFTYNIKYSAFIEPWFISRKPGILFRATYLLFLSYILIPTAMFAWMNRRRTLAFSYCITFIVEAAVLLSGALYPQYALVCAIHVPMLLNEMYLLKKTNKDNVLYRLAVLTLLIMIVVDLAVQVRGVARKVGKYYTCELEWEQLINEIPEEDRNYFVLYGGNEFKGTYLACDILPCYKYFVIQDWHARFSDYVRSDIHESFGTLKAKWILTDSMNKNIKDILDEYYEIYDSKNGYHLYRICNY